VRGVKLRLKVRRRVDLKALLRVDGQDMVEYALLVALLAFGVTAGLKSVAQAVNTTFSNISTTLSTAT
jgi:pilus assembly protein Flp/PilA